MAFPIRISSKSRILNRAPRVPLLISWSMIASMNFPFFSLVTVLNKVADPLTSEPDKLRFRSHLLLARFPFLFAVALDKLDHSPWKWSLLPPFEL